MLTMEEELERGRKFGRELAAPSTPVAARRSSSVAGENVCEVYGAESGTGSRGAVVLHDVPGPRAGASADARRQAR